MQAEQLKNNCFEGSLHDLMSPQRKPISQPTNTLILHTPQWKIIVNLSAILTEFFSTNFPFQYYGLVSKNWLNLKIQKKSSLLPSFKQINQMRNSFTLNEFKFSVQNLYSQNIPNIPCRIGHCQAEGLIKTAQLIWPKKLIMDINFLFVLVEFLHCQLASVFSTCHWGKKKKFFY